MIEAAAAEAVINNINEVSSNADASEDYVCDICETRFQSLRAVQIHMGKKHKLTGSPIPQVDGICDTEVVYTFVSAFHEKDIKYTLKEFIPESVETDLVSMVRIGGLQSADHLCTLLIKIPTDRNFIWPAMSITQKEVIKDLKTVPHFDPA